jgi:hypothetical protein
MQQHQCHYYLLTIGKMQRGPRRKEEMFDLNRYYKGCMNAASEMGKTFPPFFEDLVAFCQSLTNSNDIDAAALM